MSSFCYRAAVGSRCRDVLAPAYSYNAVELLAAPSLSHDNVVDCSSHPINYACRDTNRSCSCETCPKHILCQRCNKIDKRNFTSTFSQDLRNTNESNAFISSGECLLSHEVQISKSSRMLFYKKNTKTVEASVKKIVLRHWKEKRLDKKQYKETMRYLVKNLLKQQIIDVDLIERITHRHVSKIIDA